MVDGQELVNSMQRGLPIMARHITLRREQPPTADGIKAGGWWHTTDEGGRIVCDLCPRGCVLGEGSRGFCFVRQNRGGQMVSTTYGRSTGFCVDPIEKKPLNHFYPGSSVLSFGTAGCNLGCKFCQNWSISKSREIDSLSEQADPEAIAEAARELQCRSVAFTYNDPIIWAEYALDTARACHVVGVKTVAVTNGYITAAAREPFFEVMDAANVDLKAFSEDFYWKLTGGHLEPVKATLRWLVRETNVWVELTNLLIPRENDSTDELQRMCAWIAEELSPDVPVHFTAFHPAFRMLDHEPTPLETLAKAHEIARQAGLRYPYTGNVLDNRRQSTYCPGCGGVLIERDGYELNVYNLQQNRCRHCDTRIAGRFDQGPGDWGSRRLPVRIAAYAHPKPTNPEKESRMEPEQVLPTPPQTATESPALNQDQERVVFQAAGRRVAAAVGVQPAERLDDVLAEVAQRPVLGVFVSLKRAGQLRSCCGFLGQSVPLHQALDRAAVRAAKDDPRFPPIAPNELEQLDMEVWLLWGQTPITATGDDRVRAVVIGRHGLQIQRGTARGLLLPGVAVEHRLDAREFLEQVCRKAGLPRDAWRQDDTQLWTFEGYAIHGPLLGCLSRDEQPAAPAGPTHADVAQLASFCQQNLVALAIGATPSFYLPGAYDGHVNGLVLTVHLPGTTHAIESSHVSLQSEMPVQSTLLNLVRAVAETLQANRISVNTIQDVTVGLSIFSRPRLQGTLAKPELAGFDSRRHAILVTDHSKWALVYDPHKSPTELLADAFGLTRLPHGANGTVASMAVLSTEPRVAVTNVARSQPGAAVRPSAVAGRFYPGRVHELEQTLDELLPAVRQPEPWAGAMVLHAGWMYSGRVAASVLQRLRFPSRTIIFAAKHRREGADWAVAPHRTWALPGRSLESDPELAQQLAAAVTGLELDAASHAQEHSIEVQLPFIARLAPETRVVGVVLHGGDLFLLQRFADQLAGLLSTLPERPLLLISTDMNHYASDAETRRIDRLALDAIEALNPARLFKTVVDHRISMCGMVPAVVVMETLRRLGALNRAERVAYATSADASGDKSQCVGYAGFLFA